MIQESIVDYINSQMKLGVSRDAIKTTLTGAGWVAADVEDTLKKVESEKISSPTSAMPMSTVSSAAKPAEPAITSRIITPVGDSAAVGSGPQTIKVSDLISASPSATPVTATKTSASVSKSPLTGPAAPSIATPVGIKSGNTFQAASYSGMKPHGSRGALVTEIVLGIIIVAVGGFAVFLFMQNNSLNSQINMLNGQSSGVNSKLSALQAQVAASTTALTAQVLALTGKTQELQTELSFYAAPSGTVSGATSTAVVSGIVAGGGKAPYVIRATYGAKIYIANSKTASVSAEINSLMAGTSTPATAAQFFGTYVPGSDSITLTAVNSSTLQ